MDKKTDLELFYILPYTKKYNPGHHYYSDEICCTDYKDASFSTWYEKSLFFETEQQLLNYFIQNPYNPIPVVYMIRYIGDFKGLDDVIQITNLKNNGTGFYTILNKEDYIWFNSQMSEFCGKDVWQQDLYFKLNGRSFILEDMYKEFSKRGIKIKYNVYKKNRFKKNIDKTLCFDYVGDPYYIVDAIKMKDKQLILYRQNHNNQRNYQIEELLKQYLPEEEIYRLLYESENPLQEIFFGKNESVLTKKLTSPKHTGNK